MTMILLILTACGKDTASDVLVEVNDFEITEEELTSTLKDLLGTEELPEEAIDLYGSDVLKYIVTSKLLKEEADALGITHDDEDVQNELMLYKQLSGVETDEEFLEMIKTSFQVDSKEELIDKYIIPSIAAQRLANDVAEEEVEKLFNEHKDDYMKVRARHILVEDETLANDLYEQLQNGADFEQLAREHSKDYKKDSESGEESGIEYTFGKGEMVQEFEQQAFEQEIGVISKPVKTEYGYHIIETLEKIEPTIEEHESELRQQVVINQLLAKAKINVKDEKFKDVF